ncbi:MAG: hypothetical protein NWF06_04145 [Candidatus Bathyarchaeota archaeon]|nr:hypothetical protein [Candidatus Bathyarchaeum sp.]
MTKKTQQKEHGDVLRLVDCLENKGVFLSKTVIEFALALFGDTYREEFGSLIFASACIYVSMNVNECVVSMNTKTFLRKIGLSKRFERKFNHHYRKILSKYKLTPKKCNFGIAASVSYFCDTLNFSKRLKGFALRLAIEVEAKRLHVGKSPSAVAAGVVYIAGAIPNNRDLCIRQLDIKKISGVSTVTIRNRSQAIKRKLGNYIECFRAVYNKPSVDQKQVEEIFEPEFFGDSRERKDVTCEAAKALDKTWEVSLIEAGFPVIFGYWDEEFLANKESHKQTDGIRVKYSFEIDVKEKEEEYMLFHSEGNVTSNDSKKSKQSEK